MGVGTGVADGEAVGVGRALVYRRRTGKVDRRRDVVDVDLLGVATGVAVVVLDCGRHVKGARTRVIGEGALEGAGLGGGVEHLIGSGTLRSAVNRVTGCREGVGAARIGPRVAVGDRVTLVGRGRSRANQRDVRSNIN